MCGAAVVVRVLQVELLQRSFEQNIHTAPDIYQDMVNPAVGNLYRDHHWIIMGLYCVVGIILGENDLSRARIFLRSSRDPEYILSSEEVLFGEEFFSSGIFPGTGDEVAYKSIGLEDGSETSLQVSTLETAS
ncbi:hypothetical protein LWI29_021537 [Acer saccharum]|uniref:Uncharacterized protein n=1 Tax=Acer saccharum TaxID=4024 RepID=A0AA39W022_ACESA|nr:hypothetical protein LWI29_021537 [Acer saccharum]